MAPPSHFCRVGETNTAKPRLASMLTDESSLCFGLFLVNFEVTVVSTALVSITNDFEDFSRSSWIITAYLLTYTGARSPKPRAAFPKAMLLRKLLTRPVHRMPRHMG
jgi:MFS family permease